MKLTFLFAVTLIVCSLFFVGAQTQTNSYSSPLALAPRTSSAPNTCTPGYLYAEYVGGVRALKQCNANGTSYTTFSDASGAITPSSVTSTGAGNFDGVVWSNKTSSTGQIKFGTNGVGFSQNGFQIKADSHFTVASGSVFAVGGAAAGTIKALIYTESATNSGVVVRGATSQSANLYEGQNSGGSTIYAVTSGGGVTASDNIALAVAGKSLSIKTGSNACAGSATLAGGTATVSTTCVGTTWGTDYIIHLTDFGSSTNHSHISTVTAGTSFVITNPDGASVNKVGWVIVKLN